MELFLEANFAIAASGMGADELENWIIRIGVVPGQYMGNIRKNADIDFSNYEAVKKRFKLPDMPVRARGSLTRDYW